MIQVKWRGVGSVLGSFLVQLTVGSFVGTVGNMLQYFASYMRRTDGDITMGDLALVQAVGGVAQGIMFMMGGLIIVPFLGLRGCLYLSSGLYVSGCLLTYWSLGSSLTTVILTYGIFSASAMNMALVPTFLLPTAWFPHHKGKIIGFIQAGFGLASTIFTPLQTFLINPNNIPPDNQESHQSQDTIPGRPTLNNASSLLEDNSINGTVNIVKYFTDEDVLERIPLACLYLAAVYGVILFVGLLLVVGPPQQTSEQTQNATERVKDALQYLVKKTFTRLDFYLLFLSRLLPLVVVAGLLGNWKTLSFTVTDDDQLVAMIGSVNGVLNCLSRFFAGLLIDRFTFRQIMPASCLLLVCVVCSLVFVARASFIGFMICLWASYGLAVTHFSTVPTQAITLFGNEHSSVVIGSIGLADTFSYIFIGILNQIFFSSYVSNNSFLWFFLCLGGFAGAAIVVTALVSVKPKEKVEDFMNLHERINPLGVKESGNDDAARNTRNMH